MTTATTNLTEMADYFPTSSKTNLPQRVTGVPSLLPGETLEQAIARRAENAKRIEQKLAAKRAAKAEAAK